MKKLLIALTLITLTFQSCSKNDDDTPTPPDTTIYEGSWSGTYSGDFSGTWTMNVTDIGTVSGNFIESTSGSILGGNGTVTESGVLSMTFTNGGGSTGQFNADTDVATGNWTNTDQNTTYSGPFVGTKN